MKTSLALIVLSLLGTACVNSNHETVGEQSKTLAAPTASVKPLIPECGNDTFQELFGVGNEHGSARIVFCYNWSTNERTFLQAVLKGAESPYVEFLKKDVVAARSLESLSDEGAGDFLLELRKDGESLKVTRTRAVLGVALESSSLGKIVGILETGDAFSSCLGSLAGSTEMNKEFMAGTAKFRLTWCGGGFGTSGGTPWELVGLELQDSNAKLSQAVALSLDKKQVLKEMENGTIKVQQNHHNVCDTILVKLANGVSYGILNVGNVLVEGEANQCELSSDFLPFAKDQPTTAATFRNIYGGQKEEGYLPFASFFNERSDGGVGGGGAWIMSPPRVTTGSRR